MLKLSFRSLVILVAIGSLFLSVRANAVIDWNARTVNYAAGGGRPGPSWVLDVAVVQAAVYDAVQAIEGDYRPYCGTIPGASGSPAAAAATAARDVLINRFPALTPAINNDYNLYLAANSINPLDPGVAVGQAAAQCMIALRTGDGAFPVGYPAFIGGLSPGEWRPTSSGPLTFGWLGSVAPFVVRSTDQFSAGPPPRMTSPEYTRAYNEVKLLGRATGSTRTPEQTDLANFWNGNFPGQMNKLGRDMAAARGLSISETSRLMALMDLSMADAMITCWADKVNYNFWRPVTAIQLGNTDGNDATDADPLWLPLINTPPYPDHTSGANNLTAAATRALQLFFGTNVMSFQIATTNPGPTLVDIRSYRKLSDVRDEVVEARILMGIHFRFADADARRQAEHIAQWAHAHHFKPAN
jgi:hypothetical protein